MKKIILPFLSVLLFIGCKANKETATSTGPVFSKAELEVLYSNMINSEEYKAMNIADSLYLDKMNIYNIYPIIGTKDFKNGALKWIKKNLSKTKFTSLDEAKRDNENLARLHSIISENHSKLYSAYKNEANSEILLELATKYSK